MSSQDECLSQRTAFHTAGSHKPIEVKQQSLARVAQIMGKVGQENDDDNNRQKDLVGYDDEFDGDEVDDDLVFSTVPQRSSGRATTQIHFDEIDDDEMRRFAESFEQEQVTDNGKTVENSVPIDNRNDEDQLCKDYKRKLQTPVKSVQSQSKKRKEPCIEDLDALLNDDENDENSTKCQIEQQQSQKMSPVFKKKP